MSAQWRRHSVAEGMLVFYLSSLKGTFLVGTGPRRIALCGFAKDCGDTLDWATIEIILLLWATSEDVIVIVAV